MLVFRLDRHAGASEKFPSFIREFPFLMRKDDMSIACESVGQRHAQVPGQMIVAGPRGTQSRIAFGRRSAARRKCGHSHKAFQHFGDEGRSQPIITVASLFRQ